MPGTRHTRSPTSRHRRSGGSIAILFTIGVVVKAIDGLLEVAGGVLILFVTPDQGSRLERALIDNELPGRAHHFVATHMAHAVHHLANDGKHFAAIYLLAHGVVKVVLVAGLLLKMRIAYPAAIAVFLLFLIYQVFHYTQTHSISMLVLSALDILVIVLTVLEYRRLDREQAFR
ncbi:MAG TPA: DUF2127 domain-containing protein [Gemmatimonadales bacterium]|jgi:uncharacterized membrane protein